MKKINNDVVFIGLCCCVPPFRYCSEHTRSPYDPCCGGFTHLMPRIYTCNVIKLDLFNQFINFDECILLLRNVRNFGMMKDSILDKSTQKPVPYEALMEKLPKLSELTYAFQNNFEDVFAETVKTITRMSDAKLSLME